MDKSIDLFLATFLLLIIFLLTMLATNFILSNIFKKLDEVYAVGTAKSILVSWGFNPGYPPDTSLTDSKDPIWHYGGLSYAEYRPIINYDLKVMYTPPTRVYYGVVDPIKLYHMNVFTAENDYVSLKRFLGLPDGYEFNLYVEMPTQLELSNPNTFWQVIDKFEEFYVDNNVNILRQLDTPFKNSKGSFIITGTSCGVEECIPYSDKLLASETSELVPTSNNHFYGVSYGLIPYKGTLLEYIIQIYQKYLTVNFPTKDPEVTTLLFSDVGHRLEVATESAYPLYSRQLFLMNPEIAEEFPQFTLMRLDLLLNNLIYKHAETEEDNSHLLIRFFYLPVYWYIPDTTQDPNGIEEDKPFDIMVQVMFIPDVPTPSLVNVKEVITIVEQEDLGIIMKETYQPGNVNDFFYVFTFHWEPYLEEKGMTMADVFKVSSYYGNRVPLNVKVYVKYEYLGEEYVKAYSFKVKVWEVQEDSFFTRLIGDINSVLYGLTHIREMFEITKKMYNLYEVFYEG